MKYSIPLAARRRGVSLYKMPEPDDAPPESTPSKPTQPPGADDDGARGFVVLCRERGESAARLENLARVYGLRAIK